MSGNQTGITPGSHPRRTTMRRALAVGVAALLFAVALPSTAVAHESVSMEVSSVASRTPSTPLSGATVTGVIYPFVPTDGTISKVEFWLDNTGMTTKPTQIERQAPFDFAGGSVKTAAPFDTTKITEGAHTISIRVTHLDGHVALGAVNFTVDNVPDPPVDDPPVDDPPVDQPPVVTRWNAGGAGLTTGTTSWLADANFSDGKPYSNTSVTAIAGTTDDAVYLTERSAKGNLGSFSYGIPAPVSGSYTVTLHFAEIYFGATGGGPGGAGKRVFSANLEGGATELVDFDIFAEVGAMTATDKTYTVPVSDGTLNIDFTAKVDQPKISAITVSSPGESPEDPPVDDPPVDPPVDDAPVVSRWNSGGDPATTGTTSWLADANFSGGKSYSNTSVSAIAGTTDDAVYLTERSATTNLGSFSYGIPAPVSGSYTVTLHFAEIYFGATGGGPGGAGNRVFSANLEGGAVELVDFDIFAEVGAMTATDKTYTVPVSDGTLNIDFTAKVDQPKVSAITVSAPAGSPSGDPAPGDATAFSWDSETPAPIGRSEAQGASVGGKLYVFSGFDVGTTTTARSDVYDTATNTWTRLPDFPVEITHSPAVVDGTDIWFVGGYVGDHPGPSTRGVWKFDTLTNTYTDGPQLPAPRGAGAAAIIGRQLHFFSGTNRAAGSTADLDQPDHWALDLDGGTSWVAKAGLPNPRNHLGGISLDGQIYAIGGQHLENEVSGLQSDVHRYDPATNAWTKMASLPKARSHVATVVRDGQILVLGGTDPGGGPSMDVTAYHPDSNTWSKLPSLPAGRKTGVAAVIDDVVYFNGGSHATSTYAGRFHERWENGPAAPVALGEVAGGVIGGTLYLVGESSNATLALDLSTGIWRQNLAIRQYTGHHHTAEVISGKLYLFGGLGAGAGKVQVYNPTTNTWTLGPDMPFAAGSSSSAVIGGQIYVAGGIVGTTTTNRTARFDPVANTWTEVAAMPQGRNHAAGSTDGNLLYIAGGRGPGSGDGNVVANGFDTLQVYDPATNTWRSSDTVGSGLSPLPQARGGMGRGVFYAGEIYVMGGETLTGAGATSNGVYSRVDIYNPQTDTWRLGTPMLTAVHGIYPVVVGNRITVAGGGVTAGFSASAITQTYTAG